MKGAYDVLVSIGVITYLVPYLFVFAALVRVQGEPTGADVIHVPGGKAAAISIAIVGFCTTMFAILLSLIPSPEEPHKILVTVKVLGAASVLIGLGMMAYWVGNRGADRRKDLTPEHSRSETARNRLFFWSEPVQHVTANVSAEIFHRRVVPKLMDARIHPLLNAFANGPILPIH